MVSLRRLRIIVRSDRLHRLDGLRRLAPVLLLFDLVLVLRPGDSRQRDAHRDS